MYSLECEPRAVVRVRVRRNVVRVRINETAIRIRVVVRTTDNTAPWDTLPFRPRFRGTYFVKHFG